MISVEEIASAVNRLSPVEFLRLRDLIKDRDNDEWDRQLEEDAASGKLDALFQYLDKEPGELRPLNEIIDQA